MIYNLRVRSRAAVVTEAERDRVCFGSEFLSVDGRKIDDTAADIYRRCIVGSELPVRSDGYRADIAQRLYIIIGSCISELNDSFVATDTYTAFAITTSSNLAAVYGDVPCFSLIGFTYACCRKVSSSCNISAVDSDAPCLDWCTCVVDITISFTTDCGMIMSFITSRHRRHEFSRIARLRIDGQRIAVGYADARLCGQCRTVTKNKVHIAAYADAVGDSHIVAHDIPASAHRGS